jgi:uncharacterized protein YgbK (DUF1537 family)
MNSLHQNTDVVLSGLPPESSEGLLQDIRTTFLESQRTLIVLDDDPTGTQTCYDVVVLTSWSVPLLVEELEKNPSIIFILTNSRSVSEKDAIALAQDIGKNLLAATARCRREIVVISRSDSTLRGHFPAEVDAIANTLRISHAVRVLVPAFIEGGRFTIGDVHYIREHDKLVPVSETPFAADNVFGYANSNLKKWVEEKTKGSVSSSQVKSISLEDIRLGGVDAVKAKLATCTPGQVCIVNACSHRDLEVLVMGLLKAERAGQTFIYRTSATFVPIRAGIPAGKSYIPGATETASSNGSLVIVGSYVPKTTRQLKELLNQRTHHSIEIDVPRLLRAPDNQAYTIQVVKETEQFLRRGRDVVIHTSRELQTAEDAVGNLRINKTVSLFLVGVLADLGVRPSFVVAKGGITSSDLATKALGAKRALILGQIIPGVPVWKMDKTSRFPEMIYVVFPGNVGDDYALAEVCKRVAGK